MFTINDLKNKMIVLVDGAPYQMLEVKHLHMGRGGSSVQTRMRNLVTGRVFSRNFKPADTFEEADIERRELVFLFQHRGNYTLAAKEKPGERVILANDRIGESAQWLKPQTVVSAVFLGGALLTIALPIKMDFIVTEAPPGLKGDTVSGATKTVVIETGAKGQTPLFVNEGDVIRVNTETGEYVERTAKGY
jgi:elongation factor P